jgi:hypothetical protein
MMPGCGACSTILPRRPTPDPRPALGLAPTRSARTSNPGKYKTPGPDGGLPLCYWARLMDTSGDSDAIITNGNAQGPTTVTISKTDAAFETQCAWTKAG